MTVEEMIPLPKIVASFLERMEELKLTTEQRKMVGKLFYSFTKEMDPNYDAICKRKDASRIAPDGKSESRVS